MLQVASSRRKTQTPARKLALVATLTGLAGRLGDSEAMAGCSGLSTNSPPKQIRIPNLTDSYPSEARKYRGDPLPDPQNRDMAVPGCGELACCEQDSDPPLTPGWARDSVDRTDRMALEMVDKIPSGLQRLGNKSTALQGEHR